MLIGKTRQKTLDLRHENEKNSHEDRLYGFTSTSPLESTRRTLERL
jgi:hypothetical protein